jgi:hypothetical protein
MHTLVEGEDFFVAFFSDYFGTGSAPQRLWISLLSISIFST